MNGYVVPGSAEDLVRRNQAAHLMKAEKLIDDMEDEYPALKRIWDAVKNNKGEDKDGKIYR